MKLTDDQIARVAELAGRHTIERTTLAARQSNDRDALTDRHTAEKNALEAQIDGEIKAAAAAPATGPTLVKGTG